MNVRDFAERLSLKKLAVCDEERDVNGCYAGDLLSWVMGRAQPDNVWVTIMTNVNIIAVAMLVDVSCVVIAENAEIDAEVIEKAKEKGINLYTCEKTVYEICVEAASVI